MRNDEKQPPSPQPERSWTYDQTQQPVPPGYIPPAYIPPVQPPPVPGPHHPYNLPFEQINDAALRSPAESYYPDLTMDMGNSLGYGQGIQHHAISMPQPTQSLPRLRQERLQHLQQLRQTRIDRKARRLGLDGIATPEDRPSFLSTLRRKQPNPFVAPPSVSPFGDAIQPRGEGTPPMPAYTNSPAFTPLQPASQPVQSTAEIQRVKVARASSLISGAFLLSSILGLLQTFLFTYIFGGKTTGESYLQAYIIPNLIFTVISGGALSSAFIPVFTTYAVKEKNEKTAWHVASSALNISVAFLIVVAILAFFLTPAFVPIYSHQASEFKLTVTLTRIMLIQAVVLGSGVIISSILNAKQDFTYTALGAVLYNVGLDVGLIPGFLLTFHTQAGPPSDTAVYVATWGVVVGALLQVGVQIPGLFKVKMRYTFAFDWRHPGVHTIVRQMIPRVFNAVVLSLSTIVDRALLTSLDAGLINPYVQAFSILILPVSLFASSVSTAAFPTLASYASQGRFERVRSIIMETLRNILFLTIPSGIGLMILSFPIAQALLEHGSFDLPTTNLAAITLRFFAIGLPCLAAVEILTRSFYALQDSKTPVIVSVAQFILKIALSLVLVNAAIFGVQWGMGALAFSTSIASTIEAFVLFILLSRRIDGFDLRPLKHFFTRALLASGAMAIVLLMMQAILNALIDTTSMQKLFIPGILMAITKLFLELLFGIAAFLVTARLLNMEEMKAGIVRRIINLLRIPWL